VCADVGSGADWWDGRLFDRILLDAPCSASGIVRRHPDVRWLRRRSDLATLSRRQTELLERLWPLLAPGGKLLFATCSVFRAEGEDVVSSWRRPRMPTDRARMGLAGSTHSSDRPSLPQTGEARDHDGFYGFFKLD
jgi:16S rRNA (cytosine967-C5)-methyltransferase